MAGECSLLKFVQHCDCKMWALCQFAKCKHGICTSSSSSSRPSGIYLTNQHSYYAWLTEFYIVHVYKNKEK